MGTQEPSLEVLAEPVAILWHHQPVTKSRLVSATLLPRIQAQENLSRLLLAYLHLKPNVGGCGGPIKRIGFEANLLGMHWTAAETHQISYDYQFTYYFHIQIQSFTYKFNQLSYNILSAENFLISYRSCWKHFCFGLQNYERASKNILKIFKSKEMDFKNKKTTRVKMGGVF